MSGTTNSQRARLDRIEERVDALPLTPMGRGIVHALIFDARAALDDGDDQAVDRMCKQIGDMLWPADRRDVT